MPFSTRFSDGYISEGETKRLEVTPTDRNNDPISPSVLTLDVTHDDGTTDTFALNDFIEQDDSYVLDVDFPQSGETAFVITVEDAQGRTEKADGKVRVR